jgi:hypothetical protein
MSSTTSNTRVTLSALAERMTANEQVTKANSEALVRIERLLTGTTPTPTATKAGKGKKAKATTSGPSFKEQQAALKALKVTGKAPAGMTVKQAVEAGLLKPTAKVETKVATTKASKGTKATKVEAEGTSFSDLRAALKAHKASGAVPSQHNGTFVTVKSAIADGLMNADGTVGKAKASTPKAKAKGAQVVAVTSDKVRAADGPRRADGSITPKREWALREQLAETGKFDRHQIDKRVAKAVRKGLI